MLRQIENMKRFYRICGFSLQIILLHVAVLGDGRAINFKLGFMVFSYDSEWNCKE